jgi:hypothetical protein
MTWEEDFAVMQCLRNSRVPFIVILLSSAATYAVSASTAPQSKQFDLVVVGGSSGGFGAALAAGRMGVHVALVEDTPVLGGMLSNGISNIDSFSYESLSGIFEEFRLRVKDYYAKNDPADPIFRGKSHPATSLDGRSQQSNLPQEGGRWEPHVAAQIFRDMMAACSNVEVFYNQIPTGVVMSGKRILGVTARGKDGRDTSFLGKVVIDATHEGDIAAWAGVPYSIGREARSALEPHAGSIFYFDWTGEMLPGSIGKQDRSIPSSGYRLTVKNYATAGEKAPLIRQAPPGYKAEDYFAAGDYKFFQSVPRNKTEFNVNPVGSELPGANWDWPELKPLERSALKDKYRNHALGYLYYLQHDRGHTEIGLSLDDYTDNSNVPYRMFLREGRRIHGEVTMTEADINPFVLGRGLTLPFRTDSIGIGHYPIDAKATREKTDLSTPDKGDGDFFLANAAQPFQIPYGSVVPQKVDNLLVPVALSATHVAFSAIRMDPTWMELGQAAGTAAALSLKEHTKVRNVSLSALQTSLLQQHCRLVFFWDVPLTEPYFIAIDRFSLLAEIDGGDQREFRPEAPLTRSTLASWMVRAQHLTPSVSNQHFKDVPWTHANFREIETLYDAGQLSALGVEAQWPKFVPYSQEKFGGFGQSRAFTDFHPEQIVLWAELLNTLHALEITATHSTPFDARAWLTDLMKGTTLDASSVDMGDVVHRDEACAVLLAFFTRNPG